MCALSKLTEKSYDQQRHQALRLGEVVYADLIGPVTPSTVPYNYKCILTTIDSYTRYAQIFPLRKKSDTKRYLKILFDKIQSQFPNPGQMWLLCTDQSTEFINKHIKQLLFKYGIQHQVSEKFVSQHNGLIERFNRTLEERTRSLLIDSGFPRNMWNRAAETAEFLYTRTPHSAIQYLTPYSMWYGHTPDLRHLVLFGSRAYVLKVDRKKGTKFHPVATKLYVCGYTPTGYLLWDLTTKGVEKSCNIKPFENNIHIKQM